MHLQIVDFKCRNYNVKCGYYKGVATSICNLIQTCDDDKQLTPNVGIAIAGIVFGGDYLPPLWTIYCKMYLIN
jgi:hypothetical protein